MPKIQPGDIVAVRTTGAASEAIRLGSAIESLIRHKVEPDLDNHIAIAHHYDANGILWYLEGRPSRVGWTSTNYAAAPYTVSNVGQPKTDAQRKAVCAEAVKLLGTAYDWSAIADDAAQAFGITIPSWHPDFKTGEVPSHLVCSSYAAYLYAKAGLKHPAGDRNVTPADWVALILSNRWEG